VLNVSFVIDVKFPMDTTYTYRLLQSALAVNFT